MSDELKFFIFLIESYAYSKNKSTGEVFKEWDKHNIIQEIFDNYEMYHQERIENAYEDIDCLIATGKHAW